MRTPVRPLGEPFNTIYKEHARYVYRVLLRLGLLPEEARDMTQEVFVHVFRRLPEYETRSSERTFHKAQLKSWLRAFAVNVRWRLLRTHRPDLIMLNDAHVANELDPTDPETQAEYRELALRLLSELPYELREVFVLVELDGDTAEEIAAVLNLPVGTVNTRLREAREQLRAAHKRFQRSDSRAGLLMGAVSLEQLLAIERPIPPMPAGMEEQILERLHATPEYQRYLAEVGGTDTPPQTPVRLPMPSAPALIGLAASLTVGFAIGALVDPLHRFSRSPAPALPPVVAVAAEATVPVRASASTARDSPREQPSADVTIPALVVPAAGRASVAPSLSPPLQPSASAKATDDATMERSLLRRANEALASGNTHAALAALEEHAVRFQSGALAEERDAIWIMTLAKSGKLGEAHARFASFATAYPKSQRLEELRSVIEGHEPMR